MSQLKIAGHRIAAGTPPFIIAEVSANHNHNYDQAMALIQAAKDAGADAVKLQTYTPDTMTIDGPQSHFRIDGTLWEGQKLYDLYGEAYTPWEWHAPLKEAANRLGLSLFSTPFDDTAVDFLEQLGVPAYKIASFEIVDLPLIRRVARTEKPTIISIGMASLAEIEEAVTAFRSAGGTALALLKCTSAYPAPFEAMHLRSIPHLAATFDVPVGLSDHTLGIEVPVAAVALGACIIEKHITLSRAVPGPDSAFSLEPHEFKAMVDAVRNVEKALGAVHYGVSEQEEKSRAFRRSLFAVKDIAAGEPFTHENIRAIRPGNGLHTRYLEQVLQSVAACDIPRGTPLAWPLVGGGAGR